MTVARHAARPQRPLALQLRRRKDPAPISLPADYVPTDYTSLPQEEPPKKGPNKALLGLGALLILVLVAAGLYLNTGEAPPPDEPPVVISGSAQSSMIVSNDQLRARINGTIQNADGLNVTAELLEDGVPFRFWDEAEATKPVENGKVSFDLVEAEGHEPGRPDSEYTVQLTVQADPPVIITSTLNIRQQVMDQFVAGGESVEPTPTTEPLTVTETVVPTEAPAPTQPPVASGPLNGIVISRGGIVYVSPFGPAGPRGNVASGQQGNIVVKLPVGGETWYLTVVPATGVAGWVNSNVIDLPEADVARIVPVSTDGNLAVVFNGGNLRSAPGGGVVGTVNAGESVTLTGRSGDNAWFEIQAPAGAGWVASSLLTIRPDAIEGIPVK